MARVLMAWELGHGLGHLYAMRNLASRLVDLGHQVTVAARDLPRLRKAFADSGCRILAAPFFPGVVIPPGQSSSLVDVLWYESAGHSQDTFTTLFLAWRELIGLLKPDLMITDSAQVAQAAANGLVPILDYGHYFHSSDPKAWSIFRDWEPIDQAGCQRRAERLMDHLNHARGLVGLSPVEAFHEGFSADRTMFRILPELDYMGMREGVRYIGQLTFPGQAADWPAPESRRRIFAYLRHNYEHLDRTLGALQHLDDVSVLCFHNGIPDRQMKPAPHIRYTADPIDLSTIMHETDAVLCHGGGVQVSALEQGRPAILLPAHTEQFLTSRAAEQAGLAAMVSPLDEARPNVLAKIREVLDDPSYTRKAEAAARAHREREPNAKNALVEEVMALLP